MPLPIITDTARVALKLQAASATPGTVVNVIHVQKSSSGDTWNDIADNINAQLGLVSVANMYECVHNNWGLQEFDLTPLDGSSATITRLRGTSSWPSGVGTGDYLPQVCGVVKMQTAKRGRSYRGRVFLGPCSENKVADGFLGSSVASDITASWVAFANALESSIHPAAIVTASYKLRTSEQVINLACELPTATQRRRQHR